MAPVGAIVGVIGGCGRWTAYPDATGATAKRGRRGSSPSAPAIPACGQPTADGPRRRRTQPIKLDPFFEVRTPERNFGPARLAGRRHGDPAGAPACRRSRHRSLAPARLRPARPHRRARRRDRAAGSPAAAAPTAPAGPSAEQVKALYDPASYEEVMLDGMRRTIAARLLQAKQTIPHFY